MSRVSFLWRPVSFARVVWVTIAVLLAAYVLREAPNLPAALVLVAGGAIVAAAAIGIVGTAPGRDRLDDDASDDAARRIAELEARIDELSAVEHRMVELENRLDFAERLLADRHDVALQHPPENC